MFDYKYFTFHYLGNALEIIILWMNQIYTHLVLTDVEHIQPVVNRFQRTVFVFSSS